MLQTVAICAYLLCLGYQIYSGVTWVSFRDSGDSWHAFPQKVYRSEHPGFYWVFVTLQILALLLVLKE